jgi:hypothetical protein
MYQSTIRYFVDTRLALGGYVAASVTGFVSLEVRAIDLLRRFGLFATLRRWSFIAISRMKTVIHVALEILRAMEPWSGADEAVSVEPFRAIVARRGTAIRGGVVVTVRAIGSYAD